jgi:hypothetical protein
MALFWAIQKALGFSPEGFRVCLPGFNSSMHDICPCEAIFIQKGKALVSEIERLISAIRFVKQSGIVE